MARKDWKKTRSDKFRQVWLHKTKKLGVSVEVTDEKGEPYVVVFGNRNNALSKPFKTKSKALKFARGYMRSH